MCDKNKDERPVAGCSGKAATKNDKVAAAAVQDDLVTGLTHECGVFGAIRSDNINGPDNVSGTVTERILIHICEC